MQCRGNCSGGCRAGAAGADGGGAAAQQQACLICGAAEVAVPYSALPCGHRFCYYCLRAHTLADSGYQCPQCGAAVAAMRRWRPATWHGIAS
jgi:peroxin-2